MRLINTFKTHDGKIHGSKSQAESHALTNAQNIIKDILRDKIPSLDNSYRISQQIIVALSENEQLWNKFVAWMEDARNEN